MQVAQNKVVYLTYRLTDKENEELIEEVTTAEPMTFLYGVGQLLPEFERNIADLNTGDPFDFFISAENGYGIPNKENVVHVPKEVFTDENGNFDHETFHEGESIPMSDEDGNSLLGTILEVKDEYILMDFNHPLAGVDLHFVGNISDVREATAEELAHGHVHGDGGHHH